MNRNRLFSFGMALILSICLIAPTADAGRWGGHGRPYHHHHNHRHYGAFWPGFAFGIGAGIIGSSIYYGYPRYVYVEPPVTAVVPYPEPRPCPPPYACPPPNPPSDSSRYTPPEETPPSGAVPRTRHQNSNDGYYYTETFWEEGHYDMNGRWVDGHYVQREKRWVRSEASTVGREPE